MSSQTINGLTDKHNSNHRLVDPYRKNRIKQHYRLFSGIAASFILLFPAVSEATNGYFAHGYGARSKALAGATSALPQDAMAAAINPAGMAFVDDQLDLEIELFNPNREYSVQGAPTFAPGAFPLNPGTVKSDNSLFPVPTLGWNHKLDIESEAD